MVKTSKTKTAENVAYAQRWLKRAIKDFNAFKKLVPFDKRMQKPVRCSDPALAVYLLQQSVEKAVKACAIASGQYKTSNFSSYYKHNSLGLILNLFRKINNRIEVVGLKGITNLVNIDSINVDIKLGNLEDQVMEKDTELPTGQKEKLDFRKGSIDITPEGIDAILNMLFKTRSLFLDMIRLAFRQLHKMRYGRTHGNIDDPKLFMREFSQGLTTNLKINSLPEGQLEALVEFANQFGNLGIQSMGKLNRRDMIMNYLGIWALAFSLYILTYFTYAHESTSRYPLEKNHGIKAGRIDCDDYDENLGIVNRIGQIGYVTSLTLHDLKTELNNIATIFG